MDILINGKPDRAIRELYAWVAVDPKTGLEGICGVAVGEFKMQAVSSSPAVMQKLGDHLKSISAYQDLELKLVRFSRSE